MIGKKMGNVKNIEVGAVICTILVLAPLVVSQTIPTDKSQVNSWFSSTIKSASERTLDSALAAAEKEPVIIKVRQDGSGDFDSLTKAIDSVPPGNTKRTIIQIGPGSYKEKVKIDRMKPYITLLGDAKGVPNITYDDTALKYGTVDSATLIVESDYFVASNINIVNSAPKPDGVMKGAQAVALRISGSMAAFYNCKFFGYQDTLCDDRGYHFFKDCYIYGTVDFIFGSGTSLYLNTELYVEGDSGLTVITAQARESNDDTGYSFVHCSVTGSGNGTFLGRAWKTHPRVVFAYSDISEIVTPEAWSDGNHPERANTIYFGEYQCTGKGSSSTGRAKFTKALTASEAKPFIDLAYVDAMKWLLPPPKA